MEEPTMAERLSGEAYQIISSLFTDIDFEKSDLTSNEMKRILDYFSKEQWKNGV